MSPSRLVAGLRCASCLLTPTPEPCVGWCVRGAGLGARHSAAAILGPGWGCGGIKPRSGYGQVTSCHQSNRETLAFADDEFRFDHRLVVTNVMIGRESSLLATTGPSATAPAFLDKSVHDSNCVARGDSGKRVALTALGDRVWARRVARPARSCPGFTGERPEQ